MPILQVERADIIEVTGGRPRGGTCVGTSALSREVARIMENVCRRCQEWMHEWAATGFCVRHLCDKRADESCPDFTPRAAPGGDGIEAPGRDTDSRQMSAMGHRNGPSAPIRGRGGTLILKTGNDKGGVE